MYYRKPVAIQAYLYLRLLEIAEDLQFARSEGGFELGITLQSREQAILTASTLHGEMLTQHAMEGECFLPLLTPLISSLQQPSERKSFPRVRLIPTEVAAGVELLLPPDRSEESSA